MKAVIEIPKGDDRRRHYVSERKEFVDFGSIKEIIPVNGGAMPVDYGFLPGTLNQKEGDEIDVLVLSKQNLRVGSEVEVEPIALLLRADGDDKIVAVDQTMAGTKSWEGVGADLKKIIIEYFGFQHKIVSIKGLAEARSYVLQDLKVK
jgi:inorganic pyrophosphatase